MLFENLRVRPAAGAVELEDHRRGLDATDAIDAVLVAVEREQATVGLETQLPRPPAARRPGVRPAKGAVRPRAT